MVLSVEGEYKVHSFEILGYVNNQGIQIYYDKPKVVFNDNSINQYNMDYTKSEFPLSKLSSTKGVVYKIVIIIAEAIIGSWIVSFTGVPDLGLWARNKVIELYGYLKEHKYKATKDTGCWTPEFPANPFC